jgi:hypothetical protein
MENEMNKSNLKQDPRAIGSVILGSLGIASVVLSYSCSGIFYEMLGDHIERLPVYDHLLSVGLVLSFPLGIIGLILALTTEMKSKLRTTGVVLNSISIVFTILIPALFILFILSIWLCIQAVA